MKSKRAYVMIARSAKAEATRERICESVMHLYRERSMSDFTLDDVANRAETTVQTVLRAFKSKDNLVIQALDRFTKQGSPFVVGRPGGFLPTPPGDIAAAVREIVSVYETIGDLAVRHLGDEARNPALKPVLDLGRENHCTWVKRSFAPQLKARTGSARNQLFLSLVVATDLYTWKILRRDQKLTQPATEAVMRGMIVALANTEHVNGSLPLAELVGRRKSTA